MSIADMAADAAARQRELDRLRDEALRRAARSSVPVAGLSDEARELVDLIDLSDRKRQDAVELERTSLRAVRPATVVAASGATVSVLSTASLAMEILPGWVGGVAGGVGALTAAFALIARSSAKYNITWSRNAQAEHQKVADGARQQLAKIASDAREASGRELLGGLSDAGAAGMPAESLLGGAPGLVVMQHIEADPLVAQASLRLQKLEDAVSRKDTLLAGDRAQLFAGEPERMRGKWSETAEWVATLALVADLGLSIGTGIGAGHLFGSTVGALIGGVVGLGGALGMRRMVSPIIAGRVEKNLRKELTEEVARERGDLPARRATLAEAKDDALAHFTELLRTTPVPPRATPQSGKVEVGEDQVVVGGIRVGRKTAGEDRAQPVLGERAQPAELGKSAFTER